MLRDKRKPSTWQSGLHCLGAEGGPELRFRRGGDISGGGNLDNPGQLAWQSRFCPQTLPEVIGSSLFMPIRPAIWRRREIKVSALGSASAFLETGSKVGLGVLSICQLPGRVLQCFCACKHWESTCILAQNESTFPLA